MAAMKLYNHTCRCIINTVCKKVSENPNPYLNISFVTNSNSWDPMHQLGCVGEAGPSTSLQMVGGELLGEGERGK